MGQTGFSAVWARLFRLPGPFRPGTVVRFCQAGLVWFMGLMDHIKSAQLCIWAQ